MRWAALDGMCHTEISRYPLPFILKIESETEKLFKVFILRTQSEAGVSI